MPALTAEQTASEARFQAANREIESVRLASESLEQARAAAREADQREREAAVPSEAPAISATERIRRRRSEPLHTPRRHSLSGSMSKC